MADRITYMITGGRYKGLLGYWCVEDGTTSGRVILDVRVDTNPIVNGPCGIMSHLNIKTEHLVPNSTLARILYL